MLRLVFCYQSAVAMRIGARLASGKFALFPRSSTTSRTANSEYLLRAQFFCHKPPRTKLVNYDRFGKPIWAYSFVTTDSGRFCK